MFGFGGRRSRRTLVRAELGESLDHLMRAATHAASGVGAAVGPRAYAARAYLSPTATVLRETAADGWRSTMTRFAPLAMAAAEGARQAGSAARETRSRKMRAMRKNKSMVRRRWPVLTGLLVAGAVAGAMGVAAMRRQGQRPWDEYDPAAALDAVRDDAATIMDSSVDGAGKAAAPKSAAMEQARDRNSTTGEKLSTAPITEGAKKVATKGTDKSDGLLGTAAAPSAQQR